LLERINRENNAPFTGSRAGHVDMALPPRPERPEDQILRLQDDKKKLKQQLKIALAAGHESHQALELPVDRVSLIHVIPIPTRSPRMHPMDKVKRCLSQGASPARESGDEFPSTEPIGAVRAHATRTLEHLGLTGDNKRALPRRCREKENEEGSGSPGSEHLRSHSASASTRDPLPPLTPPSHAKPPATHRMSAPNSPERNPGSPSRAASRFRNVRLAQSIRAARRERQKRDDWKNKHRSSPPLRRDKQAADPHPIRQNSTRQIQGQIPSRRPMSDLREKIAHDRRPVASQPPSDPRQSTDALLRLAIELCGPRADALIPPNSPKELTALPRVQQLSRQQNRKSLNPSFEPRRQQTATLEEMVQGVLASEGYIDSPRGGVTTNTPPRDDQD
jgi:hypothetical protein